MVRRCRERVHLGNWPVPLVLGLGLADNESPLYPLGNEFPFFFPTTKLHRGQAQMVMLVLFITLSQPTAKKRRSVVSIVRLKPGGPVVPFPSIGWPERFPLPRFGGFEHQHHPLAPVFAVSLCRFWFFLFGDG